MSPSPQMSRLHQQLGEIIGKDPDVATWVGSVGAGGGQSVNTGRFFITLKPRSRADGQRRSGDRAAAAGRPQGSRARACSFRRRRMSRVGGRSSRSQYQYTLQDADLERVERLGAEGARPAQETAANWPTCHPTSRPMRTTATLTIDRDQAVPLRHPAATDRRHAVRCLRPAADRAVLHPDSTAITWCWRCCRSFRASTTLGYRIADMTLGRST